MLSSNCLRARLTFSISFAGGLHPRKLSGVEPEERQTSGEGSERSRLHPARQRTAFHSVLPQGVRPAGAQHQRPLEDLSR